MVSLTHIAFHHIFLLFALLITISISNSATCHVDDETGLLAFKSATTDDPAGLLETWIPNTNCCEWSWIGCDSLNNNRVFSINIFTLRNEPESYLTGTLSPSLSKLRYLRVLDLQDLRNISGNNLFSILLRLPNIQHVYISNTKLSGQIPPNIHTLKGLEEFGIERSLFSGTIPTSISKLTNLIDLRLGGNSLSGTIPKEIGQLKNLRILSLDNNQLTGSIPDQMFTKMTSLSYLNMSHNKLSGKIPSSLSYLAPNLWYIDLGHNALTGEIPSFFGKYHSLYFLVLSSNRLSGAVPKTFANLTTILRLHLSHNLLVDPFPQMYVQQIESLDLSYNNFHLGDIPKWVTTSPIIYRLKLAKCGIKIKLDNWKPLHTDLYRYIDLSENEISGSPFRLVNRASFELKEFSISGNQLKFNMETLNFSGVLESLDLSRNLVFGKLPKAISGLNRLNVSYNHLCGSIPATNFPASAFVGNDCLCGSPLPPCKK